MCFIFILLYGRFFVKFILTTAKLVESTKTQMVCIKRLSMLSLTKNGLKGRNIRVKI